MHQIPKLRLDPIARGLLLAALALPACAGPPADSPAADETPSPSDETRAEAVDVAATEGSPVRVGMEVRIPGEEGPIQANIDEGQLFIVPAAAEDRGIGFRPHVVVAGDGSEIVRLEVSEVLYPGDPEHQEETAAYAEITIPGGGTGTFQPAGEEEELSITITSIGGSATAVDE